MADRPGAEPPADQDAIREAFSILGHDIRLDIVLSLLDNWAATFTEPQSYSELMRAVGVEDSGKFNYHLDKLRGVYVAEVDGGYVPTASATALYRAVLAHRPTKPTAQTQELERGCPHCGGTLIEEYERAFFSIECTGCDNWRGMTYSFPQNGLDRSPTERYHAVAARASYHIGLAQTGQCPFCAGHVAVELSPDWPDRGEPGVSMACETCSWTVGIHVLTAVQFVPAVASALGRLGIDHLLLYRSVEDIVADEQRSEDQISVTLTTPQTDQTVTITVDDELSVLSVEDDEPDVS